jgi:HemY protein
MKLALIFLALLFVGVIGAHFLIEDSGQVLISFRGYRLETSVPVLVLLIVLAYVALRLLVRLVDIPGNIRKAAAAMRERRAREDLTQGLLALASGDWVRGEQLLGRSAKDSEAPLLHYLGAARAAGKQGASERRDRWLALAGEVEGAGGTAVLLAQAEALSAGPEPEPALATLKRVEEISPDHPRALALHASALEKDGDWFAIQALLPRLRKAKALPPAELDELEVRARIHALEGASRGGVDRVRTEWRSLGREMTSRIELKRAYARALQETGDVAGAEELIRQTLETQWDPELAGRYGQLPYADAAKQLERAERWLEAHPKDPVLLLACARLCVRNQLWGKARSYFESSLAIAPSAEAHFEYGMLLEQLGERERAAEVFRNGLALAGGK